MVPTGCERHGTDRDAKPLKHDIPMPISMRRDVVQNKHCA